MSLASHLLSFQETRLNINQFEHHLAQDFRGSKVTNQHAKYYETLHLLITAPRHPARSYRLLLEMGLSRRGEWDVERETRKRWRTFQNIRGMFPCWLGMRRETNRKKQQNVKKISLSRSRERCIRGNLHRQRTFKSSNSDSLICEIKFPFSRTRWVVRKEGDAGVYFLR